MLSFGLHRASYKSASFLSRTIRSVHLTLDLVRSSSSFASCPSPTARFSCSPTPPIKNEIPVLRPMNMVGGAFNQFPYFLLLLLGLGRQPLRFLAVPIPKHPREPSRHACDSPL